MSQEIDREHLKAYYYDALNMPTLTGIQLSNFDRGTVEKALELDTTGKLRQIAQEEQLKACSWKERIEASFSEIATRLFVLDRVMALETDRIVALLPDHLQYEGRQYLSGDLSFVPSPELEEFKEKNPHVFEFSPDFGERIARGYKEAGCSDAQRVTGIPALIIKGYRAVRNYLSSMFQH